MIHDVPLSELPADLEVPERFKSRFWYDPQRRRLCFDGFMSKWTYDQLEALSSNNQFQQALDELFRRCVPEDDSSDSGEKKASRLLVTAIGFVTLGGLVVWLLLAR